MSQSDSTAEFSRPASRRIDARAQNNLAWRKLVAPFQQPSAARATWQLANTLVPYFSLWAAMYFAKQISIWLTIPLAIIAAGFLVRTFIIFHDCAHGSFFKSHAANSITGFVTGMLTFTAFDHWRWEHTIHHRTAGDLDHRGAGGVWTMTVDEYLAASWKRRLGYRLVRHPLNLFVIAPLFVFAIRQRFASADAPSRERQSIRHMNFAVLCVVLAFVQVFGIGPYLLIQSIVLMVAGSVGLWLFYVQHQFEGVYWERSEDWSFTAAALRGSSYYQLPRVLQFLSGNIGFHHVHHLSPRIPNYNLEKCHHSDRVFLQVKPITLRASLRSLHFRLWDEQNKRLVSFAFIRELARARVPG